MSGQSRSPKTTSKLIAGAGTTALALAGIWFGISHNNSTDNSTNDAHATSTKSARLPAGATQSAKAGRATLKNCELDTLPAEAEEVVADILQGGPYEFPETDGSHFGNYERKLPRQSSSYYREYTVETPGLGHRGEKRIVTGGGTETDPEVWYYTEDHYESFCAIPDAED
ncbi:ribonuclease domain-containing protein [Corynebacterium sp. sy039]|uniref:ribonuclease domain-containing protein n=1 Tax=Corynebacterium sp. sy039 TaxID=2599641 RepID=UPI0011B6088D|nr:ribonuclease domain-containing protein [Corynebacterium sp. sy039]QDZ43002.1 ribonuclease [Corynebacterium sp. sy039]